MTAPKLYDLISLPDLVWTDHHIYEQKYIVPFMDCGVTEFIKNIQTTFNILSHSRWSSLNPTPNLLDKQKGFLARGFEKF